jgi:Serine aminopeptidase, S33
MTIQAKTSSQPGADMQEEAGYIPVPGAHLYTVLHRATEPVARILLVGPFASERQNSYLPWVRWSRYLAARRIEVLRYDYRGVGESLGQFEDMTFKDWHEDLQLLADWFASRTPALPLILHGLEMGALLAARSFESGVGDAMLLWSPPANANQALRSTLLRWVGLEQLLTPGAERRSASDYIRQLEQGVPVEVEGYQWSPRLWRDSFQWELPSFPDGEQDTGSDQRRMKIVRLPKEAAPLVRGGFVGYDEVKNFDWLFEKDAKWIEAQALACGESRR